MSDRRRQLPTVGLFAGIGGLEVGLEDAGHEVLLFSECDPSASAVLRSHFGARNRGDVSTIKALPRETQLVTAGFPCQDLSQVGGTRGIRGTKSSLVHEVFRLLRRRPIPWVVIENVPFMLHLGRGAAMGLITSELEELGYRWAYRVIDSRAFGLPQRRQRVFLLASLDEDPAPLLLGEDQGPRPERLGDSPRPCGFYWTEGNRGVGWAFDSIPTLKGGSGVGIPSPPAIWHPDGRMLTPSIEQAERLQGFDPGWTEPSLRAAGTRPGSRWRLVGNAVTVDVARWIGHRLSAARSDRESSWDSEPLGRSWPDAGYCTAPGERHRALVSRWPVRVRWRPLRNYLADARPLSHRATRGFRNRLAASTLRGFPREEFLQALQRHEENILKQELDARAAKA